MSILTSPLLWVVTACGGAGVIYVSPDLYTSADRVQISISVVVSRHECIAPCGVMFDATDTTSQDFSNPFHELQYKWNFNDVGASFENRPDVNANESVAPIAGHVFDSAGTYDVLLTVSDNNGEVATQVIRVQVENPNIAYAELTYCVSTLGSFASCPNQNSEFHLDSYNEAKEVMANIRFEQNGRPARILFRAGEEFTVSTDRVSITNLSANLLISAYGNGANPIFKIDESAAPSNLFYFADNESVTITKIGFQGNYDPSNGMGSHPIVLFFYVGSKNTTIFQNEFKGLGLNIYPHGGTNENNGKVSQYQMIVDNKIIDWQDYAVFGSFGYLGALIANTMKQSSTAVSGNEGKCGDCVPNFPDHGPLRVSSPDHLLVQSNDMFNNAGWSTGGKAHQPNIRLGTNGEINHSVVSDNFFEGGFSTFEMIPANNTPSESATKGEIIIERNRFTASDNSMTLIDTTLGGVVIRNNLFYKPNNGAPEIGTSSFKSAIVFKAANTTPENLILTNRIYNNTLISLAETTAPKLAFLEVFSNYINFEIHNNLIEMPFVSNPEAGLIAWKQDVELTGVKADHNLLHTPNTTNYVWNNGLSMDLSTWRQTGKGLKSLLSDPLIEDKNKNTEMLSNESPAINSGIYVDGLFIDNQNKNRDSSPDIGTY